MDKTEIQKKGKKVNKQIIFPLEKQNYIILTIGVVIILLGYIALSVNGVEGFMPLYAAPILLVIGYCIVIPIGIVLKKSESKDTTSK